MSNKGLFLCFEDETNNLTIYDSSESIAELVKVISLNLNEYTDNDCESVERTLGQLLLYLINQRTASGLPFGDYKSILNTIIEENYKSIFEQINFSDSGDQYDYAMLLFSHGVRGKSWAMIEKAEYWFQKSADSGNKEAKLFLSENLPIVKPRLEQKFKSNT